MPTEASRTRVLSEIQRVSVSARFANTQMFPFFDDLTGVDVGIAVKAKECFGDGSRTCLLRSRMDETMTSLKLRVVPGHFAIARLPSDAPIPEWLPADGFSAIIRADDELTIVCEGDLIPDQIKAERGWACMRTVGPFDFETTGIVHSLIAPLSASRIGIFVVCTFDGEHLLVPAGSAQRAHDLLIEAGHSFVD